MKYIHSKSIFVQLVVFSLLVSLVPIIFISGYLFRRMETMVENEMLDYHRQISSQYTKNIEEKLEQYQDSLNFIANNTVILHELTDAAENPYSKGEKVSEEVTKSLLLEKKSEIRNCMIYSMVENNPLYGSSVSMIDEAKREKWYQEKEELEDGWFVYCSIEDGQKMLSLIKRIEQVDIKRFERKLLGVIKLDLYMERLFTPALQKNGKNPSYGVVIYDNNRKILHSTDTHLERIFRKYLLRLEGSESGPDALQEVENYVLNHTALEKSGMNIVLFFDNQDLIGRKAEMKSVVLPLIIGTILLVVFCVSIYTMDFSSRIAVLVKKFKVAETGDLTLKEPIEGKDEIALLDQKFSHMLVRLDQLIKKNYVQQMENKEAQLRNLQLQINPHFLYNTLETISSIAAVKQAFVVCDMCQRLGDIFRYSLGKGFGEFVTLEQELVHIKNYIFIQKIRYGNRFEVFYNVEVDEKRYKILRFILQPIVENAILHGLGELTGTGTLEISVYEQDENLVIRITDDGVGMEKEKVEELNTYINSERRMDDSKKSIGIRNVNQRIKLSCGDNYGVKIESLPYQGSCFALRLPIIREGEKTH